MRGLALAVAIAGVGAAAEASQGVVVAEVAGRAITRDQFRAWLQGLRAQEPYASSVQTVTPAGQRQLLDRLVTERLFAEAMRVAEGARDRQAAAPKDAPSFLLEQQEASLAAARYERQLVAPVAEGEVRQFYDAHPERFRSGRRVRARHILLKSAVEAEQALADIRAGRDFAAVARARSLDTVTAPLGGDLGWVPTGVMVKPFEDALFALQPQAVSGVVQTGQGLHILRADGVDEGTLLPFDAVKDIVRRSMTADRVAAERERLAARYGARVFPERLNEEAR